MKATPNERIYRYELMESAFRLYKEFNVWWDVKNLYSCSRFSPRANFRMMINKDGSVYMSGLNTCKSRSSCPVCAYPRQIRSLNEIEEAIVIARGRGKGVYLVTYTFAHGAGDELAIIQTLFQEAKLYLYRQSGYRSFFKSLGYVGRITDYEIQMCGRNGYHPHTHDLEFMDLDLDLDYIKEVYADYWLRALEAVGLSARKDVSVDVLGYKGVGDYVTKMGSEITLSNYTKNSFDGRSMSPFQCLAMYHETSNKYYGSYWVEYVCNIKRKRILSWSRGLKRWLGMVEKIEEEGGLDEEPVPLFFVEDVHQIRQIRPSDWKTLQEAANFGRLDVVEDVLSRLKINYRVNRWSLGRYVQNEDI